MKRISIILVLLLIGISLASSFWSGIAGAGAAVDNAPAAAGAVQNAAPVALITATAVSRPVSDAVVAVDDLNMRSGPGISFSLLGKYAQGTPLTVLGQGRDDDGLPWLFVQTPDGRKGWMSARPSFQKTQYMAINLPPSEIPFVAPPTPAPARADAVIAVNDLNMRSGPDLSYKALGKYPKGTALDILGQSPDSDGMPWLLVQTPDGKKGWMSARPNLRTTPYVRINIPLSQIPPVVQLEEVEMETPVFGQGGDRIARLTLSGLTAVSCPRICQDSSTPQTLKAGDAVCLEWYEFGIADDSDRIGFDIRLNGSSLGTATLPARGQKLCRAIRMTLPDSGKYQALATVAKIQQPTYEWIVK